MLRSQHAIIQHAQSIAYNFPKLNRTLTYPLGLSHLKMNDNPDYVCEEKRSPYSTVLDGCELCLLCGSAGSGIGVP